MRVHDRLVQRWELTLFGMQVSRDWWQRARRAAFWSTVLHGAYFSYYFIVSAPALLLPLARRPRRGPAVRARGDDHLRLCYLVFIFFPVAGPYYVFPRPADWFIDNPAARLVYDTLAEGSSYGAAFPSSHVAATVAAALTAAAAPALGLLLLVPTLLLTVGVVYCQMHYGVDALAGLLVGGWRRALDRRLSRPYAVADGPGSRRDCRSNEEGPREGRPSSAPYACLLNRDLAVHAQREVRQAVELVVARRGAGEADLVRRRPAR